MAAILWKYAETACTRHNFNRNAPINFKFDVTINIPGRKIHFEEKNIPNKSCVFI